MQSKEKVPVQEGLFTMPPEKPALLASKCPKCGSVQFPRAPICNNPDCDKDTPTEDVLIDGKGILWSYTTHHYDLRTPYDFHKAPYAVGAVEFPEHGLIIVGKIQIDDFSKLEIGRKMQIVVDKLYEDENAEYYTYFFKPVEEGGINE